MAAEIYNNFDFSGWDERNRDWARDFATALVLQDGATNTAVHEVLERTRRFSNDSDKTARQMMGTPQQAAKAAFTDVDLAEGKAAHRIETSWGAFCTGMLIALIQAFIVSLFWMSGWTYQRVVNLIFVFSVMAILCCCGMVAYNYFKRGMMRACWVTSLAGLASFIFAVIFLGTWAENTDISFPTLGVLGTELLLLLLFGWFCFSDRFVFAEPKDKRDWFAQFEGVLRGQHLLTKAEAHRYADEARAHLAESGAQDPFEEFGKPATYAQQLVGDSSQTIKRNATARMTVRLIQLLCVIWLVYMFVAFRGWALGGLVIAIPITLLAIWNAWSNIKKEKQRIKEAHHG